MYTWRIDPDIYMTGICWPEVDGNSVKQYIGTGIKVIVIVPIFYQDIMPLSRIATTKTVEFFDKSLRRWSTPLFCFWAFSLPFNWLLVLNHIRIRRLARRSMLVLSLSVLAKVK